MSLQETVVPRLRPALIELAHAQPANPTQWLAEWCLGQPKAGKANQRRRVVKKDEPRSYDIEEDPTYAVEKGRVVSPPQRIQEEKSPLHGLRPVD